ncbi:MAG: Nif3-like dinuclear metal center hexameric protein [Deltaproteobacteria bacterium]|jgi:dinuclear metal center YbgI/SA1388 family protein|nr:Nif3-like dinuclear metal center hexameric protein [Deltaproteobacteria bacterium]
MKIYELINIIEKTAPLNLAESWDKSGMQVASFREEIFHPAIMLDPLPRNIRQALDSGADFLLAHHPLTLQPRFPDSPGDYHTVLSLLFKADVPLYSAHTSLDCNPSGPVRWLAEEFNLRSTRLLAENGLAALPGREEQKKYPFGFGFVGDLPLALPYAEFCRKLALVTGKNAWRSCGAKPAQVRRLACCPGSGGDLAAAALAAGADVFITGDLRYHAVLSGAPHMLDLGHFQLEEIMMRRFAADLDAMLSTGNIEVTFISGSDPFIFERS